MNPQSIFALNQPCRKYGLEGGIASMDLNEIRWTTFVNREHTARTVGFVIG